MIMGSSMRSIAMLWEQICQAPKKSQLHRQVPSLKVMRWMPLSPSKSTSKLNRVARSGRSAYCLALTILFTMLEFNRLSSC